MRYGSRLIDERNRYRRWIDPRFRTLRLADVRAYLLRRGWVAVPSDRSGYLVFQEPPEITMDDLPFYQFVPDSEAGSSYALCMFDLITGLAEVEDRQAAEVIDDIVGSGIAAEGNGTGATNARAETAEVGIRSS